MSSSLLLPNPCLLGIVFSIATHDGNQLVFHYPPKPNEFGFQATPLDLNDIETDEDDFDEESDLDSSNGDKFGSDQYFDDDEDLDSVLLDSEYDEYDGFGDSEIETDTESNGSKSRQSSVSSNGDRLNSNVKRRSSSGSENNKYSSGRDLLELLYEREQKKKRKRMIALRKKQLTLKKKAKTENSLKSNHEGVTFTKNNDNNIAHHQKEYKIEKLFSFDCEFISDLATPPKSLCNTRFELTVEDMVFLGLPIHINDDGSWRTGRKSRKNRSKSISTTRKSRKMSINETNANNEDGIQQFENEDKYAEDDKESKENLDCGMYQFNMLFVMNPPVVEYNHRIDEMFHYIISRISLLLRYEQQKSNYVWNESKKILKMREELIHLPIKQQWNRIIIKSSLAKLICDTYNSIIRSEIVNIEIDGKVNSFQVPIRKEFMTLPPRYMKLPENSVLTSISPFLNTENSDMIKHFALLLLDDIETIIKDLKAEKDSVIASFLRLIKPNESLQRLSILSGLDIQEVKLFANHLVYWRRAITILPLTSRNVYVVSPISQMSKVYKDRNDFNQIFASLPTLPTFLSMISDISKVKPRSISNLIPSRDHRDLYMDAIGWLYKHGYITQLCTFGYLKVTKEIKIKVAEDIEIEIKKKQELKKQKEIEENINGIENQQQDESMHSNIIDNSGLDDINDTSNGVSSDSEEVDMDQRNQSGFKENVIQSDEDSEILLDMETDLENNTVPIESPIASQNTDNSATNNREASAMTDTNSNANVPDQEAEAPNMVSSNSTKSQDFMRKKSIGQTDNVGMKQNTEGETDKFTSTRGKDFVNDNSSLTDNASTNSKSTNNIVQFVEEEEEDQDTILLEPEYATGLERRWITAIVEKQQEKNPEFNANVFNRVLGHFNGRMPMELVGTVEGVGRGELRRMLDALTETGVLVLVRHW